MVILLSLAQNSTLQISNQQSIFFSKIRPSRLSAASAARYNARDTRCLRATLVVRRTPRTTDNERTGTRDTGAGAHIRTHGTSTRTRRRHTPCARRTHVREYTPHIHTRHIHITPPAPLPIDERRAARHKSRCATTTDTWHTLC
eukprot:scaffold31629_cov117-Isochrysis_galbana.AAC.1